MSYSGPPASASMAGVAARSSSNPAASATFASGALWSGVSGDTSSARGVRIVTEPAKWRSPGPAPLRIPSTSVAPGESMRALAVTELRPWERRIVSLPIGRPSARSSSLASAASGLSTSNSIGNCSPVKACRGKRRPATRSCGSVRPCSATVSTGTFLLHAW